MTNTLTPEQIAQGWNAYTGQSLDPLAFVQIYTPGGGTEFGMAGDFDFTPPTDDDYETDPIGAANDFITMFRTFSPDLPSPPVLGGVKPMAWYCEKSYGKTDGEYSKWGRELTLFEIKPEPGFRNIIPLYAAPPAAEGTSPIKLEWVGTDGNNLSINGKILGSIDYSKNNGGWYIMTWAPLESDLSKGGYMPLETARANLEGAARAWLSPLTNEPVGVTETWQTACDWLETTFGPIKPERIITRAKEEFEELESAETLEQQTIEAADVVMCLMRFPGLWEALVAKMAVNRARTWELRGDGTGYHVKNLSAAIGEPRRAALEGGA